MPVDMRAAYNSFFTRVEELRAEAARSIPECLANRLASLAPFWAQLRSFSSGLLAKAKEHPFQAVALAGSAVAAVALSILGPRAYQNWKMDPRDKALIAWINEGSTEEIKTARRVAGDAVRTSRVDGSEFSVRASLLDELPSQFSTFTDIKNLSIQYSSFETIPPQIQNLKKLESIDLSYNQITEIPEWIGKLVQLESIDLSGNRLKTVPNCLAGLGKLEMLDLRRNLFEEIPKLDISKEAALYIDISDPLEIFPEEPEDSKRQPIRFSGTYEAVCEKHKAYRQFIENLKNWIEEAHDSEEKPNRWKAACIMRECYKQVKDESQYPIHTNPYKPDSSHYLDKNLELDLRDFHLTSLPPLFGTLSGIQFESGNKLYGISTLKLEGNQLSHFPEEILEIKGLQYLYLWGNPLESLPEKLPKKLKQLVLIHVCINDLKSEVPQSIRDAEIIHTEQTLTQKEWDKFSQGRKFKVISKPV